MSPVFIEIAEFHFRGESPNHCVDCGELFLVGYFFNIYEVYFFCYEHEIFPKEVSDFEMAQSTPTSS